MATEKKTTDLFDAAFIDEMRTRLEEMKAGVEKKLEEFGRKSPAETDTPDGTYPEYGDDEDDNVHEIEEFIVNQGLKGELEKELRDVESALKRIEEGTYGICKYSGEKIAEGRLQARPTSSSSVEAKQQFNR